MKELSAFPTGKLAAEYAIKIIDNETEMEHNVRALDRSLHTVNIGSCASGPLMVLLPQMTGLFSGMTVSSDIGSGSVVTKSIPSGVIAAGVPCRVIREITDDDKTGYMP